MRPLQGILDSKYHPSDALLSLFKLMDSTLSNFMIHLKIESSPLMGWPGAQGCHVLSRSPPGPASGQPALPEPQSRKPDSRVQREPLRKITAEETNSSYGLYTMVYM